MATQIDDKKVQSGAANDPSVLTEDQSVSEPGKQNKVINYQVRSISALRVCKRVRKRCSCALSLSLCVCPWDSLPCD